MSDQVLSEAHAAVDKILSGDERIVSIAPQDQRAPVVRKAAAVATNHRFILYEPQLIGSFNFHDVHWYEVEDVHLKQGMLFSDLTVKKVDGSTLVAEKLNKDAARKLYAVCQQYENEWREKRRIRQMEEDRARAGGVTITGNPTASAASTTAADDPVARLAKLKALLDQGLISEDDYNQTKQQILGSL
jgi:hypothetical protein